MRWPGILLPMAAGYDILDRTIRVVKISILLLFYYFTFVCRDLPHSAAIYT
jgi:hypothetical protein